MSTRLERSKVPLITALFWVIKVLTTAMGETTSDYFVHRFSPPVAVCFGAVALGIALVLQFRARRYVAWIYWLAVVMVAVFGTMVADGIHIELHVPYLVSTVVLAVGLAVVFWAWHASEHTLSIHSIRSPRREAFYWATVMATFALGTAAGDMTAKTVGLGYLASGLMFTAIIAVPAVAHWRFGLNEVVAFWFAYIVTRPLGASYADWLAQPRSRGGLGIGLGFVSIVLGAVIVVLVGYLAVTRIDVEDDDAPSLQTER